MNIVGGGIAGLYAAILYRELEPTCEIRVFEQCPRLGGRIRTVRFMGQYVDVGAGRFGSVRRFPLTWTLVNYLNLRHRVVDLGPSSVKSFACTTFRADPNTNNVVDACTHGRELQKAFGYDAEFVIPPASRVAPYINKYFTGRFYKLNGGLEQIIEGLVAVIRQDPHTKIYTNTRIAEVNQTYCRTTSGKMFRHDRVVVTVPLAALRRIRFPRCIYPTIRAILHSYTPVSLCRIFIATTALVPTGQRWVSSGPVRMAFRMSDYVLQVYCDTQMADYWSRMSAAELELKLAQELKKAFGLQLGIRQILRCYWKNGVHLWKLGYTPPNVCPRPWIAFAGEAVAERAPGWIEGSLESVTRVTGVTGVLGHPNTETPRDRW